MKGNFGTMLSIDFEVTDLSKLNDKAHIETFLRALLDKIGMKIHVVDGKEQFMIDTWEAEGMPFTYGTSVVLLLTTSSLQMHTAFDINDKSKGVMYLDLFSCSDFRREDAQKVIDEYYSNPTIKRWMLLER